jgi:hypothetical protein
MSAWKNSIATSDASQKVPIPLAHHLGYDISLRQAESINDGRTAWNSRRVYDKVFAQDDGSNLLLALKQKVADRGGEGNRA